MPTRWVKAKTGRDEMDAAKLKQVLDMIEANMDKITPEQMHNAMLNCERISENFGASWTQYRTSHFEWRDGKQVAVYDPCTREQLQAYVANKRKMLAEHDYL